MCVYSIILIIIFLIFKLPFVWGCSLFSNFGVSVLFSQRHNKPTVESLLLTKGQALKIWSGNTNSKTLDYQRTNPWKYQIIRTPTKETTCIQDLASQTTSNNLCRMPHPNNKQDKITNPIIRGQDYHPTEPCPSQEKRKQNKTKTTSPFPIRSQAQVTPIQLTQYTGPNL